MSHRLKTVSLPEEAHVILEAQPKQTQSKYVADAIVKKDAVDRLFSGDINNVIHNMRVLRSNHKRKDGTCPTIMEVVEAERILRGEQ